MTGSNLPSKAGARARRRIGRWVGCPQAGGGQAVETLYGVFSVCGAGGIGMVLSSCLLSLQDHLLRNAQAFT